MSWTEVSLRAFEERIAKYYADGKIRAPVHLRSGCEPQLIDIFRSVRPQDYVYCYWASHLHCLLKGVPEADVEQAILDGKSISLCFPDHKILCSGIVGSLAGIACGTAYANKLKGVDSHVYLFTGDMGAECGIFFESLKYAYNHQLPITFVVEDNGVSVMTDTKETWKSSEPWFLGTKYASIIKYFKYTNSWPHSGIGKRIAF